jgi:hypothetical protein
MWRHCKEKSYFQPLASVVTLQEFLILYGRTSFIFPHSHSENMTAMAKDTKKKRKMKRMDNPKIEEPIPGS